MIVSDGPLYTRWGKNLDKEHVLQEYPRPQFRRDSYLNLNGLWSYAIVKAEECPDRFDGEILVPFSPESPLSGVGCQLLPDEYLFYRRTFTLPDGFNRGRVLMHFDAVDQEACVEINGQAVGTHVGGYLPFTFDITEALQDGVNTVTVRVRDVSDVMYYARGKQKLKRGGIFYTAQSGIWQTVWLESVPEDHVTHLKLTPLYDDGCIRIETQASGSAETQIEIYDGGQKIAGASGADVTIKLDHFKSWSPETPFLYDLKLKHGADYVDSYFAMRKISLGKNAYGYPCMLLNNEPYFHNGLLDQGYYSDGYLTPPSDEAMIYDIQTAKDLGFNMLRKHIKIEPEWWYYACDRLGILVWQDFVNGGGQASFLVRSRIVRLKQNANDQEKHYHAMGRQDPFGREMYLQEAGETVRQLYNHPCIAVWVPFNEGWGQFDSAFVCSEVHKWDPTRLVDHASGWYDQGCGDFNSRHDYSATPVIQSDHRIKALTEFGGLAFVEEGHTFTDRKTFGYQYFQTREEQDAAFRKLYEQYILAEIPKGLSACVYTQVTDVECELNGLMTYDRKVVKLDADMVREINRKIAQTPVPV